MEQFSHQSSPESKIQPAGRDALPRDEQLAGSLRLLGRLEPRALVKGAAWFAHAWAPRFGPLVAPVTVDVLVPEAVDAASLSRRLSTLEPATRWRVEAVENVTARLASSSIVAGRGGLRSIEGRIERVYVDPATRSHIEAGIVEVEPSHDAAGLRQAHRLLDLYPGLQAPSLQRESRRVHTDFDTIERAVAAGERGGRATAFDTLSEDVRALRAVDDWHARAAPSPEVVPLPPPADLPSGDPWTAPDAQFREWLLHQTLLSDDTDTPVDPFLREALAAQRGDQKPTHQGWETWLHAVVATLQVETDTLPSERRALRVATLLHDVGKTHNVWTPGAHPLIGAKQWSRLRPAWLSDEEAELVTFLIRTHDLLGRLDRAVTTPGFRGGVSPAGTRLELTRSGRALPEALALHRAVYTADIAAVSALRWLLPLTPYLEALVLPASRPVRRRPELAATGAGR